MLERLTGRDRDGRHGQFARGVLQTQAPGFLDANQCQHGRDQTDDDQEVQGEAGAIGMKQRGKDEGGESGADAPGPACKNRLNRPNSASPNIAPALAAAMFELEACSTIAARGFTRCYRQPGADWNAGSG